MTEGDPGVEVKESPTTSLVNRDSATRRAGRLAVKLEVGELGVLQWSCVRSREAVSAFIFLLATRVLWLACEVHLSQVRISFRLFFIIVRQLNGYLARQLLGLPSELQAYEAPFISLK
jgi:hypothetical protein